MLLVPLILILKVIIFVITLPLSLVSFAMPSGIFDAMVLAGTKAMLFRGVFPVEDLMIALSFVLAIYAVLLTLRVIFMGINMIPGINLRSPKDSYTNTSSASSISGPGGTKVITTHSRREQHYDK